MKRKARSKLGKPTLEPVNIMMFGSDSDPCFGKHHSPQAKECQVCGDAEICLVVMSQKQHVKRGELEEKNSYKDVDTEVNAHFDKIDVHRKNLVKRLKKKGKLSLAQVGKLLAIDDTKTLKKVILHICKEEKQIKRVTIKNKKYVKLRTL